MKKLKIAHFGAFDHNSYGDLLFPIIAEHELWDFDLIHVSPTGESTPWSDARPSIALSEALQRRDWNGVLVGGGDIVGDGTWWAPMWERRIDPPCASVLGLWSGASLLALRHGLPLAWNAPGVPAPLQPLAGHAAKVCLSGADYVAVRDAASANFLRDSSGGAEIKAVVDTALALPRIWPFSGAQYDRLVVTVSMQELRHRNAGIAGMVSQLCSQDATAPMELVGVSLMGWQREQAGTDELSRLIQQAGLQSTRLGSLQAVAQLIASSRGYIGNSLHGLITAIAYERPAVLVVPVDNSGSHKYRGFLQAVGLDPAAHLAGTWQDVPALLCSQLQSPPRVSPAALGRLEEHWLHLRCCLQGSQSSRSSSRYPRSGPEVYAELQRYSHRLLDFGVLAQDLVGSRHPLEARLAVAAEELRQQQWRTAEAQTAVSELETQRAALRHRVADLEAELASIKASRSWQLMEPYRRFRDFLQRDDSVSRHAADR